LKIRASLFLSNRNANICTEKTTSATTKAVKKVAMPTPRRLVAGLVVSAGGVTPPKPPPDVFVGPSEDVGKGVEADIAEDNKELAIELVIDAIFVADSAVPVPEGSAEDMLEYYVCPRRGK
jgi:hypothetical protein